MTPWPEWKLEAAKEPREGSSNECTLIVRKSTICHSSYSDDRSPYQCLREVAAAWDYEEYVEALLRRARELGDRDDH